MKYNTKQARVSAIMDAYMAVFRKTAVTMNEISVWAISGGLWPVPKRGDPPGECEEWERKLEAAIEKGA